MTSKKKDSTHSDNPASNKSPDESTSAWKTPAGISAIIGAIAVLVTAITSLISALPQSMPTPTALPPTVALAPTPTQDLCVGMFDGTKVVNWQIGVPMEQVFAINPDEIIAIKFNDDTHLLIALRIKLDQKYYNVLKENCYEAVTWQTFEFDIKYPIDIGNLTLEFEYRTDSNKISAVVRAK